MGADAAGSVPLMGIADIRRIVFLRHSHPVSAWSRFLTTPLLLAPFWMRSWPASGLVGVWFAVNPVMTPEPPDQRAFATRAMLGEEVWAADPGQDPALIGLNGAGTVLLTAAVVAAWRRRALPAALGTAGSMAVTMLCWRRYAAIHAADVK